MVRWSFSLYQITDTQSIGLQFLWAGKPTDNSRFYQILGIAHPRHKYIGDCKGDGCQNRNSNTGIIMTRF